MLTAARPPVDTNSIAKATASTSSDERNNIMGKKVFVDLSHPFFGDMPLWPYFSKPEIAPMHSMAKAGVLTQTIKCTMHTGTHALYSHELPVDAYCGDAICLDLRVDRWKLIMPSDLEAAVARAGMKPS